ncbi:DNA-binding protein rif1 [Borealophlyctis nickersoniae]|nr:DNA-binding protein rif1 [Borealophlyctis nickersoniae]
MNSSDAWLDLATAKDDTARVNAWASLLATVREQDSDPVPCDERHTALFFEYLRRDLEPGGDTGVMQSALSCVALFLNQPRLLSAPKSGDVIQLLTRILEIACTDTSNTDLSQMALWCLGVQKLDDIPQDLASRMVVAFANGINSDMELDESLVSAVLEGMMRIFSEYPLLAILQSQAWMLPVFRCLLGPSTTISSCAGQVLALVRGVFLDEFKSAAPFLQTIVKKGEIEDLLRSKKDHKYMLMAWEEYVVLMGSKLHRTQNLNDLLKVVETGFNSPALKRRLLGMRAWRRLILNFSIEGHIYHAKRVNLVTLPIWNCLKFDKADRQRQASMQTYIYLLLHLSKGPPIPSFLESFVLPAVRYSKNELPLLEPILYALVRMFGIEADDEVVDPTVPLSLLDADILELAQNILPNMPVSTWDISTVLPVLKIVEIVMQGVGATLKELPDVMICVWQAVVSYIDTQVRAGSDSEAAITMLDSALVFLSRQTAAPTDEMKIRVPVPKDGPYSASPKSNSCIASVTKMMTLLPAGSVAQNNMKFLYDDLVSAFEEDAPVSPLQRASTRALMLEQKLKRRADGSSEPDHYQTPSSQVRQSFGGSGYVQINETTTAKHPDALTPKQLEKHRPQGLPAMYHPLDPSLSTLSEETPVVNNSQTFPLPSLPKRRKVSNDFGTTTPFLEHIAQLQNSTAELESMPPQTLVQIHRDLAALMAHVTEALHKSLPPM